MTIFKNRADAGQKLAKELQTFAGQRNVIVLGLPRGGVPVAFEVAQALNVPMDIWLVRKLGVPGQEELAMGAIASGGTRVLNWEVVQMLNISAETMVEVEAKERAELKRQEQLYRGDLPELDVSRRQIILVDDGLATGASMRAAVLALRAQQPAHLTVAVPTAAPEACAEFEAEVDEIICLATPEPFMGVGAWYEEFSQITDAEVQDFLARAREQLPAEVETGREG